MTHDVMIDIQDLRVKFGNHTVVDGLSLEIRRGEVFGLLGPNGAGKTTTLAAIQGLRRPNAGTILVDGLDVAREPFAVKRRLGVQLQKTAFFPMLRVKEMVALFAALYEQFPSPQEIAALLARFGLESKAEARPGQLSGG